MANTNGLTRRQFLQVSAGTAGGLIISFHLPAGGRLAEAAVTKPYVNAWLRIAPDNTVTILVSSSEMGQGVYTSMPMLVAEELGVDWQQVRAEMAPAHPDYNNRFFGIQGTGASTSIRQGFTYLREAGAAAREMLRQAAANRWGVAVDECRPGGGQIVHTATGNQLTYGELATDAAELPPPQNIELKSRDQWTIIGKPVKRLDTPAKSRGEAVFGIDVQVEGMQIGALAVCPVFGGKLGSVDEAPALTVPGVTAVVPMEDAVAVIAGDYWTARKGLLALKAEWEEGDFAGASDASINELFTQRLDGESVPAEVHGDATATLSKASAVIEAEYRVPFLAHATMEPMNGTAHVRADGADIWAPTQAQGPTQSVVAKILGLKPEQVRVHTTFLGGGFGRRFELDFVLYPLQASKAVGTPVKLIWSREEDIQHDFYRPAARVRFAASLDGAGYPEAILARIACPSIFARQLPELIKDGVDPSAVEGLVELPYSVPNYRADYAMVDSGVPVGFWRSVGHSQNAYFREAFLDELAQRAGIDPLQYRLHLLAENPRHAAVLQQAAGMADWESPPPKGRHRGLALHESFGSIVAEVAEISIDDAQVRVHEVWCAVDCGTTINPDTVAAQMESGIVYGLTAALMGEIQIENGRVRQTNFPDYAMLTLADTPRMHVHIMASEEAPGGVGEPSTPPIAPAVVNALLAATGEPVRSLPVRIG